MIIYDDVDFAAKANAMMESAADRSDQGVHWKVMPWRLDMLRGSPTSDAALTEASNAHLIVLAMRRGESLPVGLLEWLEAWATRRQVQDAALAMLEDGDALSVPTIPELNEFAQRHGLGFILDDGDPAEDEAAFFVRSLHERKVTVTPTWQHIREQPVRGYYQHWGINE